MAESTPIKDANNAQVPVATDSVTIGAEVVVVQRVKQGYGAEGEYRDVEDAPASEETLHHVLRFLQILAGKMPMPNAAQQMPVAVNGTVGITSNSSVNVAQVGGQNTATGLGASGNGAARVTPASDTVAGNPQTWAFLQSLDQRNFRNRIVT